MKVVRDKHIPVGLAGYVDQNKRKVQAFSYKLTQKPQGLDMKPQVIINNVDQAFFLKNGLDTAEVVTMLKSLPLPRYVRTVVLDGETTGEQKGEHTTRHPMIYALNTEERKVACFVSSKGRKTRNVGAKRVITAIMEGAAETVVAVG